MKKSQKSDKWLIIVGDHGSPIQNFCTADNRHINSVYHQHQWKKYHYKLLLLLFSCLHDISLFLLDVVRTLVMKKLLNFINHVISHMFS